ncbi:MAG: ABC transporter ATP-binding protein [Bacilli bacterium]|nr:ABC transporter ATP-binding protein [Bacilli bacterium]
MNKHKRVFWKFIKFAYKAHKSYFYIILFQALVLSGLNIFNAYSLSIIISYLENGDYRLALIVGGIIVLINLFFNFLNKLFKRLIEVEENALKEAIHLTVTSKLMRLPYAYLEDPHYLELKERAKFAIDNQNTIYNFLNSISQLLQYFFTLSGLITILLIFDYLLVVILVVAVIINVLLIALSLKTQIKFYQDLIPINRIYIYYSDTILDEKRAKDYRMYSIGELLQNKAIVYGNETLKYFRKFVKKMGIITSGIQIINHIQTALVYILVALRTIRNKLPISTFSLHISCALSFSQTISKMIEVGLTYLQMLQYLGPFIELVELEEEASVGSIPLNEEISTIEFRNVTFSYPRSDEIILNNVSFTINAKEKIAIVGLNGAGKTTLIKLLCRLYKPNSGDILVNGISIYDYEYDSYIKQISAVFQDCKLFAYTLKENILNEEGDEKVAYEVACKVGLKDKFDTLPEGINSLYTKSFGEGGIELSGGEAQKVAIARALYKNASLVILDEPTSALDPLAEAEIYQNFNDLVQDKTAIYISHRMSSCVFCDQILVFDQGEIKDFDSHENLIKKTESLYYHLFMTQAKSYQ